MVDVDLALLDDRLRGLMRDLDSAEIRKGVARELLQEFVMVGLPYLTGRLESSGFVFVGSELVAESNKGARQEYDLPMISNDPSVITLVFSATKRAGENARFYRTSSTGGKVFDYAPYKLDVMGDTYFTSALHKVGNVVDRVIDKIVNKRI